MKTVLMIAYFYPPLGGAGVQRTTKFIKYLRRLGWNVIVLTSSDEYYHVIDESLSQEIDDTLRVYRTPPLPKTSGIIRLLRKLPIVWRLASWLTSYIEFPDSRAYWINPATKLCKQLLRKYKVDVVYSTSSPYSSHIVAKKVLLSHSIPWVADFRDPWIDIPELKYKHARLNSKAVEQEHKVVSAASRVILNTDETLSCFTNRYPALKNKFSTIPNGYDEFDFLGSEQALSEKFTLTYTGSLYGNRTVGSLFEAITVVGKSHPDFLENSQLCFYGNVESALKGLELDSMTNFIKVMPYIAHEEVIGKLFKSHILLLFTHTDIVGELCIPGKLYEYLRAGRPILALGVGGGTKRVLDETDSGKLVFHDDVKNTAAVIEKSYLAYKAKNESYFMLNNRDKVKKYSREDLTSGLEALFSSIVTGNK